MKPQESPPEDLAASHSWLSALADGRADACGPALQAWATDADARRTWHAYQLIGDVLRSDDLAAPAQHDEAFLVALRQRLASEPVILAPVAAQVGVGATSKEARHGAIRWGAVATVAGFLMVGGAVFMVQSLSTETSVATVSQSGAATVVVNLPPTQRMNEPLRTVPPGPPVAGAGDTETAQWQMLDDQVRRDARLESYMRAHRVNSAAAGRLETVVLER